MLSSYLVESKPPEAPLAFEIENTTPAPPGWRACYLISYDQAASEGRWMSLPVVLWVTVCREDQQEIRPFVAWVSGEVLDYQDNEYRFLCLVAPDENVERAVQSILESEDASIVASPPSRAPNLPS